jgi:hypothetical protein
VERKHWLDVLRWPSWAKKAWDSTPPSVRVLSAVMWLLGAGLVVLGWIGDSRGWWKDRPFLTNLVSSLTAALFGIPFALVILERIANARADREEGQSRATPSGQG